MTVDSGRPPAKMVRPFVGGNKDDVHDARAIWAAVQQPGVKTVAVKSEEQQAVLALHRMRQQLVKFRTAQINGLRGLLTEYGEVMPRGRAGMKRDMAGALERVSERLPAMVIDTLREQWARVPELDAEVDKIERRLAVWHRQTASSQRTGARPSRRFPASACSVRRPRWSRWAIRLSSGPGASSPPGWVWCPGTLALADGCACSVSRSVGMPIYALC